MRHYSLLYLVMALLFNTTWALTNLQTALRSIHSFSAQFTQVSHHPSGESQRQTGHVRFLRPSRLFWENATEQTIVVVNDDQVKIYDPHLNQLVIEPYDPSATDHNLLSMLADDASLVRDYHIKEQVLSDQQTYMLIAKQNDAEPQQIEFTFADKQLSEIRWRDAFEQDITLTFTHIHLNEKMELSSFDLQINEQVEVIDHTN